MARVVQIGVRGGTGVQKLGRTAEVSPRAAGRKEEAARIGAPSAGRAGPMTVGPRRLGRRARAPLARAARGARRGGLSAGKIRVGVAAVGDPRDRGVAAGRAAGGRRGAARRGVEW